MPTAIWIDKGKEAKEALLELSRPRSYGTPGTCKRKELRLLYIQNSTYASWINQPPQENYLLSFLSVYVAKTLMSICL